MPGNSKPLKAMCHAFPTGPRALNRVIYPLSVSPDLTWAQGSGKPFGVFHLRLNLGTVDRTRDPRRCKHDDNELEYNV